MNIFVRNELLWGQRKHKILENSSVTVFGLGGLGCSVLQVLARAGVKHFHLYDNNKINAPDIGRQTLYDSNDINKSKTEVVAKKLLAINPNCKPIIANKDINLLTKIEQTDCYIDCVDGYKTKLKIHQLVGEHNYLVHGGVEKKFGQVCTFFERKNQLTMKELLKSAQKREVSQAICPQTVQVVGALMAEEIINILWKEPKLLDKILFIDLENYTLEKVNLGEN